MSLNSLFYSKFFKESLNMKYYTNGKNEKKFSDSDVIPEGWVLGRLKSPITTLNKMWITDGCVEQFIDKNSTLPEGFKKGRLYNQSQINTRKNTYRKNQYKHYNNGVKEILLA